MEKLKMMSGFGWAVLANLIFLIANILLAGNGEDGNAMVLLTLSGIGIILYMYFYRQSSTAIGPLMLNGGRKLWIYQLACCFLIQLTSCIPYHVFVGYMDDGHEEVRFYSIFYKIPADILYVRLFFMVLATVIVYGILFFVVGFFPTRPAAPLAEPAATANNDAVTTA